MAGISDQNWIIWNQGKNPLVNFNFMLRVELAVDLPCKSVKAFARELEYDYIQEGGLNDYVHMRRKPISRPFTLEVERYVGVDYVDPLPLGADLVLPVMLFVSRAHDQFIPGVVARTYIFTGCTVMKKTYGDLVADQSGLLVETTTLGYREMLCVDIPWSEVGDSIFEEVKNNSNNLRKDKSGAELKALGQELYEKAREAKLRAETEFDAKEADKLIEEMEAALQKLNQSVASGGKHSKNKEAAQAAMEKDGMSLQQLMDEAIAKTREARKTFTQEEAVFREKEQASRKAQQEKAALEKRRDEAEQRKNRLDQNKKALETELDRIKQELPQQLQDPKAAEEARDQAQKTLFDERRALSNAKGEYEQAYRDFTNEYDSAMGSIEPGEQNVARENERYRLAQEDLAKAQNTYKQAKQTLRHARKAVPDENAVRAAQLVMDTAQNALTQAEERLRKAVPTEVTAAQSDLEGARQAEQSCREAVDAAQAAVDAVQEEIEVIELALNNADPELQAELNSQLTQKQTLKTQRETELTQAEKVLDEAEAATAAVEKKAAEAENDLAEDTAAELTDARKDLEEKKAAHEKAAADLEQAKQAPQKAQQAIERAEADLEAAKTQVERKRKLVDDAKEDLKQAQQRLKQVQRKAGELQKIKDNGPAEGSELAALAAAAEAAEKACNDAQTALDKAETQLRDSRNLAQLEDELDETGKRYNTAAEEVNGLNGEIAAAQNVVKAAEDALAVQTEPYNAAKTARDTAAAEEEAAVKAYNDAKRRLNEANDAYDRAVKQINPLHNSLTNLKSRRDRVADAQKSCERQFKSCEKENQTLQAADDNNLVLINEKYRKVQETAKETMFHERQVREMEQYMKVGESTLEKADDALDQAEKMSATETESGG